MTFNLNRVLNIVTLGLVALKAADSHLAGKILDIEGKVVDVVGSVKK